MMKWRFSAAGTISLPREINSISPLLLEMIITVFRLLLPEPGRMERTLRFSQKPKEAHPEPEEQDNGMPTGSHSDRMREKKDLISAIVKSILEMRLRIKLLQSQ